MTGPHRSSEVDIAIAAMKYLYTCPKYTAITSDVKKYVPNYINLTTSDKEPSESRENEEKWEQIVGNIVSHRHDSEGNFINQGYINYNSGKWTLTTSGVNYLKKRSYP